MSQGLEVTRGDIVGEVTRQLGNAGLASQLFLIIGVVNLVEMIISRRYSQGRVICLEDHVRAVVNILVIELEA